MKGFPASIDGPIGSWYQKVNQAVAGIDVGLPKIRLLELLGEPDQILAGNNHDGRWVQKLMENVAGGPTLISYGSKEDFDEILVYHDPYRTRISYHFAISDSIVDEKWKVTRAA